MIYLLDPPNTPEQEAARDVWLPIIATAPVDPTEVFLSRMKNDRRQQRRRLVPCPSLLAAAKRRAYGLAHGDPWEHVDARGVTPNEYARQENCVLPRSYALRGNNVELLVAGSKDGNVVFDALANSEKHSVALFAVERNGVISPFFAAQWGVGIAMSEGGELGWYWCVMIAECTNGCEKTTPVTP